MEDTSIETRERAMSDFVVGTPTSSRVLSKSYTEADLFAEKWLLTATVFHILNSKDFGHNKDIYVLYDERMAGVVTVTELSPLVSDGEAVL